MRNIWFIARRELNLIFTNPSAYAVAVMMLLVVGIIFSANILAASFQQFVPSIQVIIGPLITLFLFTTPAITMRTISEEQKTGTIELLLTAPVRTWEMIVGKWIGSYIFMLIIIFATWIYPAILNQIIEPGIDQGLLISAYLGLVLLTAAFSSIGVAASSFFGNQIAAFFTTIGILLVLWMVSYPSQAMGGNGSELLKYLDLSEHFYATFYRGVIEMKDIIYYLSVTALSLFIGTASIESRRWR